MLIRKMLLIAGTACMAIMMMAFGTSCGGGIDPALGARLVFEEEIADGLTGQVILQDMDLLNEDDDDEGRY